MSDPAKIGVRSNRGQSKKVSETSNWGGNVSEAFEDGGRRDQLNREDMQIDMPNEGREEASDVILSEPPKTGARSSRDQSKKNVSNWGGRVSEEFIAGGHRDELNKGKEKAPDVISSEPSTSKTGARSSRDPSKKTLTNWGVNVCETFIAGRLLAMASMKVDEPGKKKASNKPNKRKEKASDMKVDKRNKGKEKASDMKVDKRNKGKEKVSDGSLNKDFSLINIEGIDDDQDQLNSEPDVEDEEKEKASNVDEAWNKDLPESTKCLMNCEAAEIMLKIKHYKDLVSDDPTIKTPIFFDSGLTHATTSKRVAGDYTDSETVRKILAGDHIDSETVQKILAGDHTDLETVRKILEPLMQHGLSEFDICMIANNMDGEESVDEIFALLPTLVKNENTREALKSAMDQLSNFRNSR